MIRVDRNSVAAPPTLDQFSSIKAAVVEKVRSHYEVPYAKRRQQKFKFDESLYGYDDVQASLNSLFHGRCAYCESEIAGAETSTARHRPRTFASSLNGTINEDHYWWLAYEWENLYHVCAQCNRSKGRRFPVEGTRSSASEPYASVLKQESALLLDPCHDDPNLHIAFNDDGLVVGLTSRGQITIDILALDRADLTVGRQKALSVYRSSLRLAAANGNGILNAEWLKALAATIRDPGPYLSARRQLAAREIDRQFGRGKNLLTPSRIFELLNKITGNAMSEHFLTELVSLIPPIELKGAALKQKIAANRSDAEFSVEEATVDPSYFEKTRLIEAVEIRDFKKIRALKLDLSLSQSSSAPWCMILGENGVGKSSILQAITLVMIGANYTKKLELEPDTFIRNGATKAIVTVKLLGRPAPLTLTIDQSGFHHSSAESKVLTLAYGATRLMRRPGAAKGVEATYAKADNLFNPFVPVSDPESWLTAETKKRFDEFSRSLKDVFFIFQDADALVRRNGRILVKTAQGNVPFSQLSDGYQSIIGITADIMRIMSRFWPAMETAEGLVLIDELGAHLHPRWRMKIVAGLRRAFPRVQFIVSTHDPLCLRGLKAGEVLVIQDDEDTGVPFAVSDVPDVSLMTAEQLLTSEIFGLHSTIDPALDEKFEEYLQLKSQPMSDVNKAKISNLEADLRKEGVLGKDRRERMMLEVIDTYLSDERHMTEAVDRETSKQETMDLLTSIWLSEPALPEQDGEKSK